ERGRGRTPDFDRVARCGERGDQVVRVVAQAALERRILAGDDAPVLARYLEGAHGSRGTTRCGAVDDERHELRAARSWARARHSRQWSAIVPSSTGSEMSALRVSSDLLPRTMRASRARVWCWRYQGRP